MVLIKNIKLIFLGAGYQDNYQGNIEIYDLSNKLISKGITYDGKYCFNGYENTFYKVNAIFNGDILSNVFYVNRDNIYYFTLRNIVIQNRRRTIIFLLTDLNYANLPIENGEIVLWQR